MQTPVSLNDLYMQFIAGLLSRKDLEGLIFISIQKDHRRYHLSHWKSDERDDFLSWLYPRISRAIDLYHNQGASFDSYIASLVRFSAKEYRSRLADKNVTEHAAWMARLFEEYTIEDEQEYGRSNPSQAAAAIKQVRNPSQLLMLVLKCYNCVSDDFLERVAPRLGIGKDILKQMIERMERLRFERDRDIYLLRERINSQFYRCIVYEKRIAAMPENSACSLRVKAQLERARKRLTAMRERYAAIRFGATNSQVAEILGLTKGAVDSGLHALKKKWDADSKNPC